jgi:thiol-disulfide isomerase/thioredoxin
MVRLATILITILLASSCSNSEANPAAAPETTPAAAASAPAATEPAAAPQPAPASPNASSALSFKAYGGRDIAIEDYKGKVVMVLFLSTDCPHCQTTARLLAPIYRQYQAKGVEFLGLAVNPSAAQNLPAFVAQYGVEFPIGLGTSTQWYTFAKLSMMKTPYVPHVLFVGKDGAVAENHPGDDTAFWQDQATNIAASLDRLLAQ